MSEDKKVFVKVELKGKNQVLWQSLQSKFFVTINAFLDQVIDHEKNSTVRDEVKKFTSALLDYGKQKLYKAGLENDKIIAEVELLYSKKEKEIAESRKINAEADSLELRNSIKRLKLSLSGMKVLMIGENGQEEILFLKQIDEFLTTIKEIENDEKL